MKKFLSLFCFFTFAFLFLSSTVKAEITSPSPINPTYNDPTGGFMPSPTQYQGALSESGANLEKFTLGQLDSTIQGLTKIISGYPSLPGEQVNGGAISGLGNLVAGLYTNQPISSREYLAYVGQNIGFTTPTYAASQTGFNALSPVLPLWTIMRNLAYLAFVFIFVVIGLMVMLRKKIDPRTVASIQEALPRIVVALILVTFSYALVGLIVDLTQLTTAIIGNILVGFRDPTAQSIGDFLARFQEIGANKLNIFTAITPLINVDLGKEFIDPIQKSLGGNGGVIGFISTGPLKDITGGLVGLVVAIAILTTLFKIFFNLFYC